MELNKNITYKIYCPDHRERVVDKLRDLGYYTNNEGACRQFLNGGDGFVINPQEHDDGKLLWVFGGQFYDGHIEDGWPDAIELSVEDLLGPPKFIKYKLTKHSVV